MIPARGPQTMFHHYHRMAFLCLQRFGRLRLALLCLCMLGIALPYFASRIQKICDIQLLLYCFSPADNACHIASHMHALKTSSTETLLPALLQGCSETLSKYLNEHMLSDGMAKLG